MQHMNSVRVPATVIFTALLIIIMVSSSRTTYTLAPAPERTAVAACAQPVPLALDGEALLRAADQALYLAKQAGRDRVLTA